MSVEDRRREQFQKLAAETDAAGGALYVAEKRLREAHGSGRWSERIAAEVESDYLPRVRLRLWPGQKLWRDQSHEVLLFTENSPLGEVVQFVQKPSRHGLNKLKASISTESNETLAKVRALVCDR